jgi:hypothetical protein
MSTVYYILFIAAALYVIGWYIRNDGCSRATGLIAMKDIPEADTNG